MIHSIQQQNEMTAELKKDFSELYKNTCTKMKEAVKEYKIKKLQDEINKLKG